jgi:hypothetical protein
VKLLLTSSGISNPSIEDALVGLLGKPIAESSALIIPTAIYRLQAIEMECPRFRGHLSACSAQSDLAERIVHHATGIELPEAVHVGVSA